MCNRRSKADLRSFSSEFPKSEEGGITVLALFMFMIMLLGAGFAIDVNNATQARVQLQGAADAAGHAALLHQYQNEDTTGAALKGKAIAEANMPTTLFGEVLATTDIVFGDWDSVDRTFTPGTGTTAVQVTTRRIAGRDNAVTTFLLKLIGYSEMNLTTTSVWDYDDGFCPPRDPDKKHGEGFFAMGVIDIQSNNDYFDGFCIHSDTEVQFQNGNDFEDGVTVSMPNKYDLVVPDWDNMDTKNTGLPEALASMDHNLSSFFNDLPDLIASYGNPSDPIQPSYITDKTQVYEHDFKNSDKITQAMLTPNAVNKLTCKGGSLTFANNEVISDVVMVTDCEVKFGGGGALENAVLATTDTGNKSVNSPSSFRIGAQTYCSNGGNGGATILTMGDFSTSAGMMAFGANIIANGNIGLTANADGMAGVNFMAGGRIDVTSNSDMGFCNEGPPKPFEIPVFRMVM